MLLGALEAGGTKFVCALGDENGKIIDRVTIPTDEPEVTMEIVKDYFKRKHIAALGVASFGPVDLHKSSTTYGYITSTPKPGWANFPLVKTLEEAIKVPVGFDTDVNGSLLGEVTYGSAKGLKDVVYITIGTGIGGGILVNGKVLHGVIHSEMGHMLLKPREDDKFEGVCPFHGNCFEGMASGPAIEKRWGRKAEELSDKKEVWELESYYIAQALANLTMILSPRKIILGGGVMKQEQLFPMIREKVVKNLNGYIQSNLLEVPEKYIVPAGLKGDQGIIGCLELAKNAL
jgi:fructokinase